MLAINVPLEYCMWDKFGGLKFWRCTTGEEYFGEPDGRSSVHL